ncbi:hypothetical protein OAH12_02350, partial [Cyclobacteriaceae bacterium]|nr:hypothetical protein [Cyclobacteriaceae bacterium]
MVKALQEKSTSRAMTKLALIFFLLTASFATLAEGTRELRPTQADHGYLTFRDSYNNFAQYNCPVEERLQVTICNIGEEIYFGTKVLDDDYCLRSRRGRCTEYMQWRLVAPDGTTYHQGNIPRNDGDQGKILDYNSAVAGPSALTAGGYDALSVTANQTGDWYLEFYTNGRNRTLEYIDITVADAPGGNAINGRVWSKAWCMSTLSFDNAYQGSLFMYSTDQIVTELNFNGIRPYVYVISANRTGLRNTGNFDEDRKSRGGFEKLPEYKIFLNAPDESCHPTGTFGELVSPSTVEGCGLNKCINIYSNLSGSVLILLDLNGTPGYQPGTEDRQLSAEVLGEDSLGVGVPFCIPWDSRDGLGNIVTDGVTIDLEVDYLNGITHLPMYDVELHQFGYTVTLIRPDPATIPGGPQPLLFWDDTEIINSIDLNGCASVGTNGCHTWGDPNDSNNSSNSEGNENTINTWWYANVINEQINTTQIVIGADANVNIPGKGDSNDTTICDNVGSFQLFGEVTGNVTGSIWSTSGDGSFSDVSDPGAFYTPGTTDLATGVTLTITTVGAAGSCPPDSDYMRVTFTPGPALTINGPAVVCENNSEISITTTQTVAGGVEWLTGNGIYVPGRFVNDIVYTPDTSEVSAGQVTLNVQTTNNGICPASEDSITVLIDPAPVVSAGDGTPQNICENNSLITLDGSFSNASQITWSGGNGTFSDVNDPNSTYQPTPGELTATTFTLTLTTDAPGTCLPESDDVVFVVSAQPTVNGGGALTGCDNNDTLQLSGAYTVATGILWTTTGDGQFIPNDTTPTAQYVLGANDKSSGAATLTITTTGNGLCSPVSDIVPIVVNAAPDVTIVTSDVTTCANNPTVSATVTVAGSSGGTWAGNGTFSPNNTSTTVDFTPSGGPGNVFIIYTADDIAGCNSVTDTLLITITPNPLVLAGADQTLCKNNNLITVSGVALIADYAEWGTTGTGAFGSAVTDMNNTFTPSQTDLDAGYVDLFVMGTFGVCLPVYDTLRVDFTDEPTLILSPDQVVCENNPDVTLSASITIATGVTWTGNGSFSSPNSLNTTYTPTAAEITSGSAQVTATTTGNGLCNAISEVVNITFTPAPTVDAGPDQTVCFNNRTASLNGTITGATQGIWTGGAGRYRSNNQDLTLRYQVATSERDANNQTSVVLTLTSTDNGNCLAVSDDVTVFVDPRPSADFAADRICGDESSDITVTVQNATGIVMSGGYGTYTPDNTSLSFTYTPSAQEIIDGSVRLTATTTGNGNCNARNRTRTITIDPIPTVDAGNNLNVCDDVSTISLNGISTNTQSVQWSTSGSGSFGNRNDAVTSYTPSQNDIDNGPITLTLLGRAIGQCDDITDQITINFSTSTAINAGPNQTACSNSYPIQLNATGSPATWSGGAGTFSNVNDLRATYTPAPGETPGSVTLTVTTAGSAGCPAVTDQVTLNLLEGPTVVAGPDQTLCANETISLSGTVSNSTGGLWTTNGTGNFSSTTTLNSTYTPSTNDIDLVNPSTLTFYLSTVGSLPCAVAMDSLQVTLMPAPTVDAGPDITICATDNVSLNGSFTNTTGITWTSSGTGGVFGSTTNPITTYTPSSSDTTNRSVTLTMTSTATANCPVISDDIVVTFSPSPISNPGTDITACADAPFVQLNGTVTNATSGIWGTNGTGTFSLSNTILNPEYYPSSADTLRGNVNVWMETSGNGVCSPSVDTLTIIFTPAPFISAGPDFSICADIPTITLTGSMTHITQGVWTTNGTGTFDNPNNTVVNYTPSQDDRDNRFTIRFTFTSVDHGLCQENSDDVLISLIAPPTVDAGFAQNLCADVTQINLAGSFQDAGGIQWSTTGGGSFDNNTISTPVYTPVSADTAAGSIMFYTTTTGNGLCSSDRDSVQVTFTPVPTVNAGIDHTICSDTTGVLITGRTTNAPGVTWTTSGSGTFSPHAFTDTVVYVASMQDTANSPIQLTLTVDNGICPSASDNIEITIIPQPLLTINAPITVCGDSTDIQLSATIQNAPNVAWTTGGSGVLSDTSSLTPAYTPSSIDTLAGSVTLTVSSSGNSLCRTVTESTVITFESLPTASAGNDVTICADVPGVSLNGQVTNSTGGTWTTTDGTGAFGPNATTVNATYHPSPADTTLGQVELIFTSTSSGECSPIADTVNIFIQPLPVVDAGPDMNICADFTNVSLTGSVTNAQGAHWTTTTGTGIFSDEFNINTQYAPSTADTATKVIDLILSSSGNGACQAVHDTLNLLIAPELTVFAGVNDTICADEDLVRLNGSSTNASYTEWSTSGNGVFTDFNATSTHYSLNTADKVGNSQITFTLTAIDSVSGCQPKTDFITIVLTPIPTVEAGNDLIVCDGITSIPLSGVVQNAGDGRWEITNGAGSFSPNADTINTDYIPNATDFAAGFVELRLYSALNGQCLSYNDNIRIDFSAAPPIDAGNDTTICDTDLPFSLQGALNTGDWIGGGGTFTPNRSTSNALYQPTNDEINLDRQVKLY